MKRRKTSLERPPQDPRTLRQFPCSTAGTGTELWRVVRQGHGPWWFGCGMTGRFDLPEPEGTCYLATDELTALLEVLGPERSAGRITTEELSRRRLHRLCLPVEHSLADLTSRQAAGFGVTLEIHSHPQYRLTQAWARRLRQAGADGLLYLARHDPAAGKSVALFGPAGERTDWERGPEQSVDLPEMVQRLWNECRIRVSDRPRAAEIEIVH